MTRDLYPILHHGEIGGHIVRFFKTPMKDGKPDLPWVAMVDLMQALNLDGDEIREVLQKLRGAPDAIVHSIATAEGVIQIVPHFMAQGFVEAFAEMRKNAKSPSQYHLASFEAAKKLMKGFSPSGSLGFILAASKRWLDEEENTP